MGSGINEANQFTHALLLGENVVGEGLAVFGRVDGFEGGIISVPAMPLVIARLMASELSPCFQNGSASAGPMPPSMCGPWQVMQIC